MSSNATIIANEIKPPMAGKKRWIIKQDENSVWWANQDVATRFTQGGTYNITYRTEHFNNKAYNIVETADLVQMPQNAGQQTSGTSGPHPASQTGGYVKQDQDVQRSIFVCGALNSMLKNTSMFPSVPSAGSIVSIVNMLCSAYQNSAMTKKQAFDPEMGDEIPFN